MSEAGSRTPSPLRDSPPDSPARKSDEDEARNSNKGSSERRKDRSVDRDKSREDSDNDGDESGSEERERRRRKRNRSEESRRRRRHKRSSQRRERSRERDSDNEDEDDRSSRRRSRGGGRHSRRRDRDRDRERDRSSHRSSRRRHRRRRSLSDSRDRDRNRRRRRRDSGDSDRSGSDSGDAGSDRSATKKKSNFTPAGFTMPQHMNPAAAALLAAANAGKAPDVMAVAAGTAASAVPPVPGVTTNPLGEPGALPGTGGLLGASPGIPGIGLPGNANALVPGLQQFPGLLSMVTNPTADKTARELFVGNTPPGTSELVLMEFLNAAMKQVKLNTSPGNPIISCRMSTKFAFIELRSAEEANNCLSINGIPFMGYYLKVGRPTKYQGPHVQASTWQALTGQQTDPTIVDPSTKVYRELYIGNVSPEMTETALQEFLGSAMQQVGLTTADGNPILQVRLSGTFAFVEVRTVEEASHMMNLNGIPFMGQFLKIKRPTKFPGPEIPHLNWEDILAKYMAGELKAKPNTGVASAPSGSAVAAPLGDPSKVMTLSNMVTNDDLEDDETYEEILEDTKEECEKYGTVQSLAIPRPKNGPHGIGLVFVQFSTEEEAKKAIDALKGRTFAGNKVEAKFFPEEKYLAKDYSESTTASSDVSNTIQPPGVAEAQAAAAAIQIPPPPPTI